VTPEEIKAGVGIERLKVETLKDGTGYALVDVMQAANGKEYAYCVRCPLNPTSQGIKQLRAQFLWWAGEVAEQSKPND
jgi:hypothetical protein